MSVDTAFALAGLGGFNAHGAGFLQAARDNSYVPDLVTATSGQILVLDRYLAGADLKASLVDGARERDAFAQMKTALFGYPKVFEPAYGAAITRLFQPPDLLNETLFDTVADRLLPAQQYVPVRPDEELQATVERFNGSTIGVVFNAYDPATGKGVLYGNNRARDLMDRRSKLPVKPTGDERYGGGSGLETQLLPIDLAAIKAALWLSLYGFEGLPGGKMDGAYHRACILSELHSFSRVMVARPLANGWLSERPRNWFDVQDWQCEMWFSVGYKAEVDAMKRINAMIDKRYVREEVLESGTLKTVEIIEIEPPTPAGYFNFFIERGAVFDRAYALADARFKDIALRDGKTAAPRAEPDAAAAGETTPGR